MTWEKVALTVGLIGGLLGISAAVGGGIAWVGAYVATHEQLRVVDCYQYYRLESLSAQTEQIRLLPEYRGLQANAAQAQVNYELDKTNATLLAAYKDAVNDQNETYERLKKA